MRFEIAVHPQRGRMRSDLPQQSTFNEKLKVIVDRGQRNGWNATPHSGINLFRGMVAMRRDVRFLEYLALVSDCQTVLIGQFRELFMAGAHNYWIRMIIKRPGAVS